MHLKAIRVSKVIIVDANDNAPEFVDNVLAASVSEVRYRLTLKIMSSDKSIHVLYITIEYEIIQNIN